MDLLNNVAALNIITWLLLGAVAGILVHIVDGRSSERGAFTSVAMGTLGGLLGGVAASYIFGSSLQELDLSAVVISVALAIILALAQRIVNFARPEETDTDYTPADYTSNYNPAYYSDIRAGHKSQDQVEQILDQVEYPVSKSDLVNYAEHQNISRITLTTFESLPDEIFESKDSVLDYLD